MRPGVLALLLALSLPSAVARAEPAPWLVASVAPEGSPLAGALDDLMRAIERVAGGRVQIRTRYGAILGDEPTTLALCRQGRLAGWAGSVGVLAEHVPGLNVFELPYLFEDAGAVARGASVEVLDGPLLGKEFERAGLAPVALAFIGWRSLATRDRAVRSPREVAGLRIRTADVPVHRAMWGLLGARTVPIELPEVAQAFRDGRTDAVDLPLTYVFATSIQDAIRHYTRTAHRVQLGIFVMHRATYEALPRDLRRRIHDLRAEHARRIARANADLEAELLGALRAGGRVAVHDLEPAERAAWKRALAPAEKDIVEASGRAGAELLRAVRGRLGAR